MKKIIIIELVHFQYALTITSLFKDADIIYIFTPKILESLQKFKPDFNPSKIWVYDNKDLDKNIYELIERINNENPDLFFINPIFDNFKPFAQISKDVKAKKILTTHNINTWFRPSVKRLRDWKEKKYKKQIINNSDFIAVEDFIYAYLKNKEPKLFNKYNFIYIPFTLFSGEYNKIDRNDNKIKIVLPGSIDYERRRYETTLKVIKELFNKTDKFIFSFAGPPIGEYGKNIVKELKFLKEKLPNNIVVFDEQPKPEEFRYEMESADVVLSTSTKYFYTLGTKEEIGKTKPTAAIHDMISFVMPGILPAHLDIPNELKSSSQQYKNKEELLQCILNFEKEEFFNNQKNEALLNSNKFTPEKILEKNTEFNFNEATK